MSRSAHRESLYPPLWFLSVAAVCGLVWLAVELREILFLLVVGYCIAYVMNPMLTFLEKRGISRPIGFFAVLLGGVALVLILMLTALPTIAREYWALSENLPSYLETAREKIFEIVQHGKAHLPASIASHMQDLSLETLAPMIDAGTVKRVFAGLLAALLQGYSVTLTIINLFLLPFIVFYFVVDFSAMHQHALALLPTLQRERVRSVALEIDSYISAFLCGQLTVGAILFVLYAIGFKIVGIELWFLIALISGFGNMVPYLGSMVGIVLATLMALVTFGDFWHVLAVLGVFVVVQGLEGTVITPRVLGDRVGLSPLAIILAIVAGGSLFGLIGIFLAVPGAAALKVLVRHLHGWILTRL